MMHDGFGFGYGFGGPLMWLFWLLVIAAVVWGVSAAAGGGGRQRPRSALEILEERYARGEINREEFESKKRDLSH